MNKTAHLATYVRSLFVSQMGRKSEELKMPMTFSLDILEECHFAVRLIIRALKNQSKSFSKVM